MQRGVKGALLSKEEENVQALPPVRIHTPPRLAVDVIDVGACLAVQPQPRRPEALLNQQQVGAGRAECERYFSRPPRTLRGGSSACG